jgi:hypothetical protein
MRSVRLALLAFAATSGLGGCGAPAGCHLTGNGIVCTGETFADCSMAGCFIEDLGCQNPPVGCQVAPDMILAHYSAKPPNDYYFCRFTQSFEENTCRTWTETGCEVTVTSNSGTSMDYYISDATCPP